MEKLSPHYVFEEVPADILIERNIVYWLCLS